MKKSQIFSGLLLTGTLLTTSQNSYGAERVSFKIPEEITQPSPITYHNCSNITNCTIDIRENGDAQPTRYIVTSFMQNNGSLYNISFNKEQNPNKLDTLLTFEIDENQDITPFEIGNGFDLETEILRGLTQKILQLYDNSIEELLKDEEFKTTYKAFFDVTCKPSIYSSINNERYADEIYVLSGCIDYSTLKEDEIDNSQTRLFVLNR